MSSSNLRLLNFLLAIFLFPFIAAAQCPPASHAGIHVVKKGETLFRVATQYPATMDQISTWNNLGPNARVYECQELVVSAALTNPAPAQPATYSNYGAPAKQAGDFHTVRAGETAAALARLYGYTEERFREFNNLRGDQVLNAGAVVRSSECSCGGTAATPTTFGSGLTARGVAAPPPATANRSFMKLDESAMLDEINLLRSNPAGYVPYVREFLAEQKASRGKTHSSVYVNSLISTLEKSPALAVLQAHPCLYQVAKTQGDYLQAAKLFSHNDAMGTGPWSRTKAACPQVQLGTSTLNNGMTVGNENLVAGFSDPRDAVISLLIDEYEPTLGHRATLLAPEWRYAAPYNFGTIGRMPNHYVQVFGR